MNKLTDDEILQLDEQRKQYLDELKRMRDLYYEEPLNIFISSNKSLSDWYERNEELIGMWNLDSYDNTFHVDYSCMPMDCKDRVLERMMNFIHDERLKRDIPMEERAMRAANNINQLYESTEEQLKRYHNYQRLSIDLSLSKKETGIIK